MERFTIKPVSELQPRDRQAITALLDTAADASAFQYPHAGNDSDVYCLLERDGQLCFSGRASAGFFASRYLPFLRVLVFNRGPVAMSLQDLALGLRHVQQWARSKGFIALNVVPELEWRYGDQLAQLLDAPALFSGAGKRYTLRMDVSLPEESLMQALPSATRYKIRRALKEGVELQHATDDSQLEAFLALHAGMTDRKGIASASPALLRALWRMREAEPDRVTLLLARHQGELLGANLLFRNGKRTEYLFGAVAKGSKVLHGDVTAGYPLQWGGIRWSQQVGCACYDFGGFNPAAKMGPAFLKKSFFREVEPVELCPPFTIELSPAVSGLIRRLRRIAGRAAPAAQ